MKIPLFLIVLLSGFNVFAGVVPTRILENDVATVTLSLHERDEAEPVSKPKEIQILVKCKNGFKQLKGSAAVTVCSADLQDKKAILLTSKEIHFFHFEWDAKKSSNNMEGSVYCDSKKRFSDILALADFCETKK